jgi:pimeloyl-ACP methyl ester carboxylesterase
LRLVHILEQKGNFDNPASNGASASSAAPAMTAGRRIGAYFERRFGPIFQPTEKATSRRRDASPRRRPAMAVVMRAAATDVTGKVIAKSGHWLMEEQPAATVAVIRAFLDDKR